MVGKRNKRAQSRGDFVENVKTRERLKAIGKRVNPYVLAYVLRAARENVERPMGDGREEEGGRCLEFRVRDQSPSRTKKAREYPPPILSAATRERSRRFKRNMREKERERLGPDGALQGALFDRPGANPIGKRNTADPLEIIKP